jgi:hypothetical protein
MVRNVLKMVLVDDFKYDLTYASKIIDWSQYDIQIIGTAENGSQAMKLIDEFQPELADMLEDDILHRVLDVFASVKNWNAKKCADENSIRIDKTKQYIHLNYMGNWDINPLDQAAMDSDSISVTFYLSDSHLPQLKPLNILFGRIASIHRYI